MRIEKDKTLVARLKPEFAESRIALTPDERVTLKRALSICEEAGALASKIFAEEGLDDCGNNSFEWARIYLAEALADSVI